MVIVDANVLLYAVNEDAIPHAKARRWIEEALNGHEPVGFAWVVLLAFLRIATLPASSNPLTSEEAFSVVEDWLSAGPAKVVEPTSGHMSLLRRLVADSGTAGNLLSDAHLAALSIEHRASLCSFERDFARFPGVRVFAPN